jgi:Fe2+ transport system protein FeoA
MPLWLPSRGNPISEMASQSSSLMLTTLSVKLRLKVTKYFVAFQSASRLSELGFVSDFDIRISGLSRLGTNFSVFRLRTKA